MSLESCFGQQLIHTTRPHLDEVEIFLNKLARRDVALNDVEISFDDGDKAGEVWVFAAHYLVDRHLLVGVRITDNRAALLWQTQ